MKSEMKRVGEAVPGWSFAVVAKKQSCGLAPCYGRVALEHGDATGASQMAHRPGESSWCFPSLFHQPEHLLWASSFFWRVFFLFCFLSILTI